MTNKTVTMSRELIEKAANRLSDLGQSHISEPMFAALLAAPAVERQEPVGRVSYIGNGFIRVRCDAPPKLESLVYTSPPAPVAVVLPERKPTPDQATFNGGNAYYAKCFDEARSWNACLDKVKEMNE